MTHRTPALRRALRGALLVAAFALGGSAFAAGVLDKARDTAKLNFGIRADTRPFAFVDGGKPAGFSVALCEHVADAVKAELKLPRLQIEWVPVTATNRFEMLQQGRIDLNCGTDTPTLERRTLVDFSIPIFLAGTGAVMRIDGDRRVRDVLANRAEASGPIWRGNPGELGRQVTFAVVRGTTIEKALLDRLKARRVVVNVVEAADNTEGIQMVIDGRAAALIGQRAVLLDAARRPPAAGQLQVIDRIFTREVLALALPRGDDDWRLLVDRSLSRLYRSKDFAALFTTWFGAPDAVAVQFFQSVALPD